MIKKMALIVGLTALFVASNISPAFASHRTKVCEGTTENPSGAITGGSFRSVLVPEGETCTLVNVTVEKDVVVLEGARLYMFGSEVGDDLRGRSPASIVIDCSPESLDDPCTDDSSIHDDVVISGTTSDADATTGTSPNRICNTFIGDDLEIEESGTGAPWDIGGGSCVRENNGTTDAGGNVVEEDMEIEENAAPIDIANNTIFKDLEVEDNTALVTITNNEIGDDLDCDDNNPAPQGSANTVGDDARDQCSAAHFTAPTPAP